MSTQAPVMPLLLTARAAARYLGIATSTLYLMRERDTTFPAPVAIPGHDRRLYRREDLRSWVRGLGRS